VHNIKTIAQMQRERVGNVGLVNFREVAEPSALPTGIVEVEIYVAAFNYKNIVVMGIVLNNETIDVITRVTPDVSHLSLENWWWSLVKYTLPNAPTLRALVSFAFPTPQHSNK
jgi:hypothetical protein